MRPPSKIHVAAFTKYDREAASTRQRFLQYLPHLAAAGIEVEVHSLLDDAYVRALASGAAASNTAIAAAYARRLRQVLRPQAADLLWVYAELFPWLPASFERLALCSGRPLIYDIDDAFFHPYDDHPNPIVRSVLGGKLKPLIVGAATVCAGNDHLKLYADYAGAKATVLPTVVDTDQYVPAATRPQRPLTIGWIGSPSTWSFVRPLLPLLADLCRARGVVFSAVGAGAAAEADRFDGLTFVPWSEASEIASVQAMDIGIMPLPDEPWARGKSGYKLVQYMACGLPVVASPVGVNAVIVAEGKPAIYDEPFADSSQIPTYIVSRFARQDVTVAISGDGGDELFAGYNRHRVTPALWRRMSALPRSMRKGAGMIPAGAWNLLARAAGEHRADLGDKAAKAARIMARADGLDDVHDHFVDEWFGHPSPVRGGVAPSRVRDLSADVPGITRLTYADAMTYLPDDILAKVDRAAMAVSLETRVPFLDHRVAAVAARIDPDLKVHAGKGKQILRKLLYRHVPSELVERPKAGFSVPVGEWIRGPLRDWAEELLDPRRLSEDGYFDAKVVRDRWEAHLAGQSSTAAIWAILMFQAWCENVETVGPSDR